MIYNYFVLALIPCQIWLYFYSILCILYFMWDFIVWAVCERVCEDWRQHWRSKEFSWVACEKTSCEVKPCAQHMTGMRKVMTAGFCEYFTSKAFQRDTRETFCFAILAYLLHYVFTHTIYTIITHILRGVLFRKKTLSITLESYKLSYL